jgi:hypothetical protein
MAVTLVRWVVGPERPSFPVGYAVPLCHGLAGAPMMVAVDNDARSAVVAALLGLAGSSDYRDRADAGQALAVLAERPETTQPLLRLLLDPDDTFVTAATAAALLRRADGIGLAAVAHALAGADDNHADWLYTAVQNEFSVYENHRDAAVRICDALIDNADPLSRNGLTILRDMLTAIDPILHSAGED